MCGIFGIYNFKRPRSVSDECLHKACEMIRHRGPDDEGIYRDEDNGLFLAHRRLSILDVSSMGHQPMQNPDGTLVVTYNGEIYNYLEIRADLIRLGHTFRSECDTEVLLHAYEQWGIECLDRFNGMFAFCLWDRPRRKLILVRDRLGIKPLYYLEDPYGIAFASEVKAFRVIPEVRFAAEEKYIPVFLRDGYVAGEETFFRGVRKIPPGTSLEIEGGKVQRKRYWDIAFRTEEGVSEQEWEERLDVLLEESVNLRLRSDVPVGVFLSGGLDSTSIVAFLHGKSGIPIKTFSVGYKSGKGYDETPFARIAAKRYQTDHREYFVTAEEFRDFIPSYVWFMDEPISEAAGISLYFISRLAKEHVTVILSGEGSDELFGGYDIYRYMLWMERYRTLPGFLRKGINAVGRRITPRGSRSRKYFELAALPLERRYRGVSFLPGSALDGVCVDLRLEGFQDPSEEMWEKVFAETAGWGDLNRLLHADTKTWLVDDILVKADKMTMANSLELRVPFLDYRIVELAAAMPVQMKVRGNVKKYVLKRTVRGRVPDEIVHREKMGFPTPIALMFRGQLNGYMKEMLLDGRTLGRGFFSRKGIETAISEHERGNDRSQLLWRLLVLEEWFRVFVDHNSS
jgi:asparagine synthase (glutamine-hydrolysing)